MKTEPDPHFGSEEDMREWAARENLDLVYEDEDSTSVDWHAVYDQYRRRIAGDAQTAEE